MEKIYSRDGSRESILFGDLRSVLKKFESGNSCWGDVYSCICNLREEVGDQVFKDKYKPYIMMILGEDIDMNEKKFLEKILDPELKVFHRISRNVRGEIGFKIKRRVAAYVFENEDRIGEVLDKIDDLMIDALGADFIYGLLIGRYNIWNERVNDEASLRNVINEILTGSDDSV